MRPRPVLVGTGRGDSRSALPLPSGEGLRSFCCYAAVPSRTPITSVSDTETTAIIERRLREASIIWAGRCFVRLSYDRTVRGGSTRGAPGPRQCNPIVEGTTTGFGAQRRDRSSVADLAEERAAHYTALLGRSRRAPARGSWPALWVSPSTPNVHEVKHIMHMTECGYQPSLARQLRRTFRCDCTTLILCLYTPPLADHAQDCWKSPQEPAPDAGQATPRPTHPRNGDRDRHGRAGPRSRGVSPGGDRWRPPRRRDAQSPRRLPGSSCEVNRCEALRPRYQRLHRGRS